MSSSSALKYKIAIKPSYYAGVSFFLLYCFVISFTLFMTPLTMYSSVAYLLLFLIALGAGVKAYRYSGSLLVSESGLVELKLSNTFFKGKINSTSFYNGFLIFLKLKSTGLSLSDKEHVIIYRDAISDEHFRLLARLISSGQK